MRITDMDKLQVGHWGTMCCHLDLYRIEDEADLADHISDWKDAIEQNEKFLIPNYWDTKRNALLDIRADWGSTATQEIAQIDALLATCE